jgi:hypothetical protein
MNNQPSGTIFSGDYVGTKLEWAQVSIELDEKEDMHSYESIS